MNATRFLKPWCVAMCLATIAACDDDGDGDTAAPYKEEECPSFLLEYNNCSVRFSAPGAEILIDRFEVAQAGPREYLFIAESNFGELPFPVVADRVVRQGQDQRVNADGTVDFFKTHESSVCEEEKILGNQVVFLEGGEYEVQDLEFVREGDNFVFRLSNNGEPQADVLCEP